MKTIFVNTISKKYPIYIDENIIYKLSDFINNDSQIIIISQQLIFDTCNGKKIFNQFMNDDYNTNVIFIENSENAKDLESVRDIYQKMIDLKCNRQALLIAFGGGVVGDVTGFIASTFMRGIKYIQVPTTFLSMIDSSIGGKTGINFKNIKNYIGTFYNPEKVIIDPKLISSLSLRDKMSALGEVIKYGIIDNVSFLRRLNYLIKNNRLFEINYLKDVIYNCCLIKVKIIESDEFDLKNRQFLNFGHTFAHAIEACSYKKEIKHGEAVLIGMKMAAEISFSKGLLNEESYSIIINTINLIPLPKVDIDYKKLFKFILKDKKNISNKISLILLKDIGKPIKKDYDKNDKTIKEILVNHENFCN